MKKDTFYYFIHNNELKETRILISDSFLGEVGEVIDYKGGKWVITDYSWEFEEDKQWAGIF